MAIKITGYGFRTLVASRPVPNRYLFSTITTFENKLTEYHYTNSFKHFNIIRVYRNSTLQNMLIDYKQIVNRYNVQTIEELYQVFWDSITAEWIDVYTYSFPKHGEISLQRFWDFAFVVDHIWDHVAAEDNNNELPETRVVAFFGISNSRSDSQNRTIMRRWGLKMQAQFGKNYDKGHFMAHGFGGPIDVNLFPQRRDINRGWSIEGKLYRSMERYVAANPGILVFSFPHYNDLSYRPSALEYGYFDRELNLVCEVFPNL